MAPPAKKKEVLLFYCIESEELARKIAALSDSVQLQSINWRSFDDGFPNLFINNAHDIRGRHVAFLASFSSPCVIFEQLSVIFALPRLFVASFTLVLPFFPTGSFERMEEEGDVATAFTMARILSNIPISRGGPTSLVIYDIHALQERFYFGDHVLPCFVTGIPMLKQYRLRWINYLSPHVKKGDFSEEEEYLIIRLHKQLGNRWSLIAGRVPGRTDNQVKNHWNTHLSKKLGVKRMHHKGGMSSLKVSRPRKEESETLSLVTFSNPKVPNIGGTEPIMGTNQPSWTALETELSENMVSSFWLSSENSSFSTPSLMDVLLDGYSPDVIWNDLKF